MTLPGRAAPAGPLRSQGRSSGGDQSFVPPRCGRRSPMGGRAVVPERGLRADGRARPAGDQVSGRLRRAGTRLRRGRRAREGARAFRRADSPPGSAPTSASPHRRSGSSVPRSRSRRFLAPAIRGERIGALGITEPGAGSTSPGSARAPSPWTAAMWSTARRRSSRTACAPTLS